MEKEDSSFKKRVPNFGLYKFKDIKDREKIISNVTSAICLNFISVLKEATHKKLWHLFAFTGGSGTGKKFINFFS